MFSDFPIDLKYRFTDTGTWMDVNTVQIFPNFKNFNLP